jgi:hypothetical protein
VNATRAQIFSALSAYRRGLEPDASLLIYYAGHGYNDKEANKAYWLPVDATLDDTANWIIADEITAGVRVIPARHVLIISDSCYSGMLTRGLAVPPLSTRDQFLQKMSAGHSRTLMASGGDEPVADGGEGGHSIFAAALLRGLQNMITSQFTAAELFSNYIIEPVAGQAEQTPVYDLLRNSGHEDGDFVFLRTGGAQTDTTTSPLATTEPSAAELEFWDTVKSGADPEEFRAYLRKYPNGHFADLARRRAQAALGHAPDISGTKWHLSLYFNGATKATQTVTSTFLRGGKLKWEVIDHVYRDQVYEWLGTWSQKGDTIRIDIPYQKTIGGYPNITGLLNDGRMILNWQSSVHGFRVKWEGYEIKANNP